MKLPSRPSFASRRDQVAAKPRPAVHDSQAAVRPQGCCAEVCVTLPLVGEVCHCTVSAPFC